MRTLLLTCAALGALALPAAAAARPDQGFDNGTLVIRGADNGDGIGKDARPVATIVLSSGFVIGRVLNEGRIAVYSTDPNSSAEVTGVNAPTAVSMGTLAGSQWTGTTFTFRAVGGPYKILIWGSGVYVFASGTGTATLTGNPDQPKSDGTYSLNGGSWTSLPGKGQLPISG